MSEGEPIICYNSLYKPLIPKLKSKLTKNDDNLIRTEIKNSTHQAFYHLIKNTHQAFYHLLIVEFMIGPATDICLNAYKTKTLPSLFGLI